jgi:hypothetical protein
MCAALGDPHHAETDSRCTFGGEEDCSAWELPSGQRVLVRLRVPYGHVVRYGDPPDPTPVVATLSIDTGRQTLEILEKPLLHPAYGDPD